MALALSPTWAAYKGVVGELRAQRGELAELQMAERQTRFATIERSTETSVSGQKRDGEIASLADSIDIINLQADIAMCVDMLAFLHDAVSMNIEVVE